MPGVGSRVVVDLRSPTHYLRSMPTHRKPWVELTVLREKDGMSKTALAKAAGMSLSYLCDLENGQREPNAAMRTKLATALNVPKSMLEKRRWLAGDGDAA